MIMQGQSRFPVYETILSLHCLTITYSIDFYFIIVIILLLIWSLNKTIYNTREQSRPELWSTLCGHIKMMSVKSVNRAVILMHLPVW